MIPNDVFGGGDEVTNRSWCVAVDVAAAVDVAVAVAATTIFLLSIDGGGKVIRIALTTRECNVRVVSR